MATRKDTKPAAGERVHAQDFDADENTAPHLALEPEAQFIERLSRGPTVRRMQRKDPGKHPRNVTATLERGLQYVMSLHPRALVFLFGRPAKVNAEEAAYLARQCDALTFDDPETGNRTKRYVAKFQFQDADGNDLEYPVPDDVDLGDAHLSDVERAMIARRNRGRRGGARASI